MDFKDKLELAYLKIKTAKRVLLIGHISPDADALASLGAMLEITRLLRVSTYAYAEKKPIGVFDFIPHADQISATPPPDLHNFDLIISLDCGSVYRTALADEIQKIFQDFTAGRLDKRPHFIEIDHHEPQGSRADLEIRLPDKAATTEIIYHFLKVNNLGINKCLADCILIGLMTDTGHFLHANSSREALAVAAEMLLAGASLTRVINNTVNNKSFNSLKVWGRALERLRFNRTTGFAFSALTAADLKQLEVTDDRGGDYELYGEIVSFISRLDGVRVALLLREEEGRVKGSFRTSKDTIDVSHLAQKFGGGGHKKAAGFSLPGRLKMTANGWRVEAL